MDIPSTAASSYLATAQIGASQGMDEELRLTGDKARDLARVDEFAKQFEEMMVRHMLKEANKPMFGSDDSFMGVSNPIYKDMYLEQVAKSISSSGSLGLAEQLRNQLTSQLKLTDEPVAKKPGTNG